MARGKAFYSTKEAAQVLGITVAGMWYHLQRGHIRSHLVGNSLVFTRADLDAFTKTRRKRGRPRKEGT